MSNKLRTRPRYFTFLITISLLFALPTFANSPKAKTRTKKTTQAQSQNSEVKITKFDASIAYDIWTQYYQAKEKGINPPLPVFKPNADTETTKQLMAMWDQGQQKARNNFIHRTKEKPKTIQQTSNPLTSNQNSQVSIDTFDMQEACRTWANWYKQCWSQGVKLPYPTMMVSYSNEEEFQLLSQMWSEAASKAYEGLISGKIPLYPLITEETPKATQQAKNQNSQPKDLKVFNAEVAYKIWTEYYQAKEKGENLHPPNFKPLNAPEKETNKLIAMWNQGKDRAYKKYIRRADQKDNYDRMKNILKNVGLESTVTLPTNFTSPTYDANGSMTSADGRTYSYDFKHRLIGITGNNLNVSLVYNGLGHLVSKTVNGITTDYLIDSNNITGLPQVVEEIQNGQVIKQYSYGADGIISQRQLINGERVTSFYGKDGHGSIRYLTDINGNITDTYDYDAFGNLINQTGNTPNNYLYAGERFDSDLGLYYLRSRFMNTVTGRFLTQDKFLGNREDPKSLHKYLYVANDPVNKVDPTGRFGIATVAAGIGISNILSAISTLGFLQIVSPDGSIEFGKGLLNPTEAGNVVTQPGFDGGAQYELTMGNKYCKNYDIGDETVDDLDLSFNLNIEFKYTPSIRLVTDTGSASDPTNTFFRRSTITENGQILEILGKFDRGGITINDSGTGKGIANLRFITSPFLSSEDKRFKVNRDGTSKFIFQLAGFNASGRKLRKSSTITIKCPK